MCFSASASFTASAVLLIVGVFTIRANTRDSWFLFSLIPLLFGVQQFAEGMVWVTLQSGGFPVLQSVAAYTFLAFAVVGWPGYMTLAVYRIESQPFRKRVLKGFLVAALLWALVSMFFLPEFARSASIEGGNIFYGASAPFGAGMLATAVYAVLALLPFFITHERELWVFGGLAGVSGLLTLLVWTTYLSVWCFFAAIISLYVYYVVRREGGE